MKLVDIDLSEHEVRWLRLFLKYSMPIIVGVYALIALACIGGVAVAVTEVGKKLF